MAEEVVYTLSLRDQLTNKLHEADGAAKKLEGSIHGVGERLKNVAEAFGVSFALFKGIEFVHQSVEEFDKLEQVQGKIEANLSATQEKAGLTAEALSEMANKMTMGVHASVSEIADMQSQLLTFPSITKDVFQQSMGLVADIAKQTGHELSQTAIMYGKALNDPAKGLQKMMRYGVMFTDQEKEKITQLQESGHLIQAQKFMMDAIAHSGYGGVAKKMFDADPLARFNKAMYQLKLDVGEAATKLLRMMAPAIEGFVNGIREAVHWMKEHKALLEVIGYIVGTVAFAYLAYQSGVLAVSFAVKIATAVQWLFNGAISANPIGALILGIAALAAGVIYCYKHFEKFRAVLWAVWGTIKEFASIVGDVFTALGHVIHGTFTLDLGEINKGMNNGITAIANAAQRLGKAAKDGYKEGLADFAQDHATAVTAPKEIGKKAPKLAMEGSGEGAGKSETKKAQGAKNLSITVNIGSLVKEFNIRTSNLMESAGKIREKVTEALTDALNDSQHVAGA
jgi:phage-related protein